MPRLIDAEDIKDYWVESEGSKEEFIKENMPDDADYYDYSDFFDKTLQAFKNVVNTSPTIDAEPVVYCKDCKYFMKYKNRAMCNKGLITAVKENHFCSCGAKMDEVQE